MTTSSAHGLRNLRDAWNAYSVLNGEWVVVDAPGETLERPRHRH